MGGDWKKANREATQPTFRSPKSQLHHHSRPRSSTTTLPAFSPCPGLTWSPLHQQIFLGPPSPPQPPGTSLPASALSLGWAEATVRNYNPKDDQEQNLQLPHTKCNLNSTYPNTNEERANKICTQKSLEDRNTAKTDN